jgi:O-antigen ligase
VLFAIAAIASAFVWQRITEFQAGSAADYARALVEFVRHDYFVEPGDFWQLVSYAALLEGLGLFVAVAAISRMESTFVERAMRMLILGGAGIAALSVVRLAEILLRNPGAIAALRATSVGLRISPQIPDYIAAGSYFALCWLAALGMAVASSRHRLGWLAAGLPLMAALYLTGSRSVIAAALAGLVAMIVFLFSRQRSRALRGVLVFAIIAIVVMVASYRWMSGRDVAGQMAWQSLTVRFELIRAGVAVIATRPLFGIGLDRFYLLAGALASPQLQALWQGRMNPHNDFLRIGAELGLIGLGLFLWILVAAGTRIWSARGQTRDPLLASLAGGLIAFLVTSLVSNPLMLRDVSYVFWVALGLAVGRSAIVHSPAQALPKAAASPESWRAVRVRDAGALVIGALLVLSIPFRAGQ